MNVCKSCGEPIKWARTPKGRRIPLDPEPVDNGNIMLRNNGHYTEAISDPKGTHVSHFSTCPNAAKHRRARDGR